MGRLFWLGLVSAGVVMASVSSAEDWPHWRGPTYDGVAQSPGLVDGFEGAGPKKLWESERLSPKGSLGYGSVSVADGRAYVYVQAKYKVDIEERVIAKDLPAKPGYVSGMPQELLDAVEKTRLSEERAAVKNRQAVKKWVGDWLKANVKDEHRRYTKAAQARLTAGRNAASLEDLAKLDTIKGTTLPNQQALEAWMKQNNIDEVSQKQIQRAIPKNKDASDDYVACLDAATGKTVWTAELPSTFMWFLSSCTPTVVDGKCYVLSSEAKVTCLDAEKGDVLWTSEFVGARGNMHNRSSSVLVVDGVAIVATRGRTSGLDAETGKTLWQSPKIKSEYNSAVPWKSAGKTYALMIAGGSVRAIEPETGKEIWSVPGGGGSTPTIAGEYMAVNGAEKLGLILYKMTGETPEKLWSVPFKDQFTSPVIHDGYVYVFGESYGKRGKGRGLCVEIATGKVAWDQMLGGDHRHSSPVLADGKIIVVGGSELYLVKATPEKYTELGKTTKMGLDRFGYASPTFADGKVYLRTGEGVVCCDLRK